MYPNALLLYPEIKERSCIERKSANFKLYSCSPLSFYKSCHTSHHSMTSRFFTCLRSPGYRCPHPSFHIFPLAQGEGHPACWESASILLHCLTHLLAPPTPQCSCNASGTGEPAWEKAKQREFAKA